MLAQQQHYNYSTIKQWLDWFPPPPPPPPHPRRNILFLYATLLLTLAAHAQRRVIVVGWSVGRSVGLSVCVCVYLFPRFLSNRGCCIYQTWICGYVQRALGTARVWSGVVQEQHVYGGGPKIIYSYYTRYALIIDRRPAWDGFASPAETEATCIWKVSPQIVVGRLEIADLHGMPLQVQLRQKQRVSGR